MTNNHPNRSKRAVRLYCDYHTPTIFYALHQEAWYIVPATSTGWSQRRPWHPTKVTIDRLQTPENEVAVITRAWQAEAILGIPRDVWTGDAAE